METDLDTVKKLLDQGAYYARLYAAGLHRALEAGAPASQEFTQLALEAEAYAANIDKMTGKLASITKKKKGQLTHEMSRALDRITEAGGIATLHKFRWVAGTKPHGRSIDSRTIRALVRKEDLVYTRWEKGAEIEYPVEAKVFVLSTEVEYSD